MLRSLSLALAAALLLRALDGAVRRVDPTWAPKGD